MFKMKTYCGGRQLLWAGSSHQVDWHELGMHAQFITCQKCYRHAQLRVAENGKRIETASGNTPSPRIMTVWCRLRWEARSWAEGQTC